MDGAIRGRGGDRVGGRLPAQREVYAAIDLGTNNCRLLIARPTPGGFRVIDAFSRVVRLGEGLSATGELSAAAMNRTLAALKICRAKMRRRGVTRTRAVATEACRRARNCGAFLRRVKRETGLDLEIITADEEVRLALVGCAPLLDPAVPGALVFDIGGGSTEMSWLEVDGCACGARRSWTDAPRMVAWHSLPFGVSSLAERHGGWTITPRAYREMVAETEAALAPFEAEYGILGSLEREEVQMLGTSGTVTTLAGVHQDLPRYDRALIDGCYLGFDTVETVSRRIAAMSYDERVEHPCIGSDRADLVIAGCAILEAICRTWPVGRLRVADRGLREGMLITMMQRGPQGMPPAAAGQGPLQ